jgi:hypothetical protein
MLRQDDFVKGQVVLFAWRQGMEYGGHKAACMMMSVLANRVKAGWGTWLEVLQSAPKYAAHPYKMDELPDLWNESFTTLLHEIDTIYAGSNNYALSTPPKNLGYVVPPVPALYWADTRRITSEFFKNKIQFNVEHPRIGDMNTLTLYA